jgi:hypothetical protein
MFRKIMPQTFFGHLVISVTSVAVVFTCPGCVISPGTIGTFGTIGGSGGGLFGGTEPIDPTSALGILINTSSDSRLLGVMRGSRGELFAFGNRDSLGNPSRLTSLVVKGTDDDGAEVQLNLLFNEQGIPDRLELPDGSSISSRVEGTDLIITISPVDADPEEVVVPLDFYDPETQTFDRVKIAEIEAAAADLLGEQVDLDPLIDLIEEAQRFLATKSPNNQFIFRFFVAAIFASVVYASVAVAAMMALATVRAALQIAAATVSVAAQQVTRVVASPSILAAELAEEAAVSGSHQVSRLHQVVQAPDEPGI